MEQMEAMARARPVEVPAPKCDNIMIDMETLGTHADSMIVSIGAVKFTLDGYIDDRAFYCAIDLDSQKDRDFSHDTLAWWMRQSDGARAVFQDTIKLTLMNALEELAEFIDNENYKLWSNGADFDIPILNHALKQHGMKPLVKFWNHSCFRTVKNMFPQVPKPAYDGVQHNALIDARQQALWLQAIEKYRKDGVIAAPPALKGFKKA